MSLNINLMNIRTTVNPAKGIKGKLNAALEDYKHNPDDNRLTNVFL